MLLIKFHILVNLRLDMKISCFLKKRGFLHELNVKNKWNNFTSISAECLTVRVRTDSVNQGEFIFSSVLPSQSFYLFFFLISF